MVQENIYLQTAPLEMEQLFEVLISGYMIIIQALLGVLMILGVIRQVKIMSHTTGSVHPAISTWLLILEQEVLVLTVII